MHHSSRAVETLFPPERKSILSKIGNTPLVRLEHIPAARVHPDVQIWAKAEWFNPGGSVKDRPALNMLLEGEKSGSLTKEKIIIDATSGNTGIAYAMLGAVLGYRVHLAIPANVSSERKRILSAYAAEITFTDPLEGTDGARERVKDIVGRNPDAYFFPDQYNNPANWQAHYKSTALEIFSQTGGEVTHFVGGLGTTGTFVGVARRLKELNPSIRCLSFQPDLPMHGLEGLKHLPTANVPGIYDSKLADGTLEVSTETAYGMMQRLVREEGLLVGPSSAAALCAALEVAQTLEKGIEVTIFPDNGMKYLSEPFWNR